MVGDDARSDVRGALAAGLQGLLVRTGKFRPGDDEGLEAADDLSAAVDRILAKD